MDKSSSSKVVSNQRPLLAADTVLQNRYRIVRQLGSGGMGAVYEAVDQRLDATVAIKETFSVDDRLRRQFEQEARLLAQLHHPNLPRVSDYFTEAGRAFLVMQFIAGDDLARIISQQPGPFPPNQVIAWADQLLDALIYLHTRDRLYATIFAAGTDSGRRHITAQRHLCVGRDALSSVDGNQTARRVGACRR